MEAAAAAVEFCRGSGGSARCLTRQLDGAVGHNLVRVHVRLCARARLPDSQGKMLVKLALNNLMAVSDSMVREER